MKGKRFVDLVPGDVLEHHEGRRYRVDTRPEKHGEGIVSPTPYGATATEIDTAGAPLRDDIGRSQVTFTAPADYMVTTES